MKLSRSSERIAQQVIVAEAAKRNHLIVALGGAHAYGFAAPDSIIVLDAIHVAPTENLLGLRPRSPGAEASKVRDNIEVAYSSAEIGGVLLGVLNGNGTYLERVLGREKLFASDDHEELTELVRAGLSRACYRHYRGLAWQQRKQLESREAPTLDELLLVLRTALTGLHLLRAAELVVALDRNAEEYGFIDAVQLIEDRVAGEHRLSKEAIDSWSRRLDGLFQALDDAVIASPLPHESPNGDAMEAWLLKTRLAQLDRDGN